MLSEMHEAASLHNLQVPPSVIRCRVLESEVVYLLTKGGSKLKTPDRPKDTNAHGSHLSIFFFIRCNFFFFFLKDQPSRRYPRSRCCSPITLAMGIVGGARGRGRGWPSAGVSRRIMIGEGATPAAPCHKPRTKARIYSITRFGIEVLTALNLCWLPKLDLTHVSVQSSASIR